MKNDNEVELAAIDESEPHEVDETKILYRRSDGKFLLRTASGCSCWGGEYDTEEYDSIDAIETALESDGERCYNPSITGARKVVASARAAWLEVQP